MEMRPNSIRPAGEAHPDTGLAAFAMLLGFRGKALDIVQLRHELGHGGAVTEGELLRLASREPGVRARAVSADWASLARKPLPALACGAEGWFLIAAHRGEEVLIHRPGETPRTVDRATLSAIWSGRLVLVAVREADTPAGSFDVRWFLPQIVRYRRLIGEVLLLTFVLNLLGLAAPLFFQNVIDKVLVNRTLATLQVLVVGFVAVSLWEVAFGWLRTRLFSETSQKLDVELGARLFRHLLHLPIAYFESRRAGDTVTRVRQLETIRSFLTNASLSVLVDPVFTIVFLVAMALYSLPLFGIVALTIPAYAVASLAITGPLRRRTAEKFQRSSAMNAFLVETVSGMPTVKAAAVEPQWQDRWERHLAAYSAANQRTVDLGNTGSQAVQLVSKLSLAAILFVGAEQVIGGALTVGGLVAFNMFAQRVSGPVIRMAQLWQEYQEVRQSIDRLGDILNQPVEPSAGSRSALPAIRGEIRFHDVRFRYDPDGPWTLDGIDITIRQGEMIGIVGSSGSGKSTLAALLQRMYVPRSGRVLIDDHDISAVDPAWLRRQIGVVLQANLLFNRTVRENIAFANPALSMDRVIAAAKLAGAHDFITAMPRGYDTLIEERGANLSGGQRQRVAIARALVTRPRILIFDEATSALDAESEHIVQRNLAEMARGRTVVIIAHRLSAVRACNRILVLERGRIVEQGNHDELVTLGQRYAALHTLQSGASA